MKPTQSHSLTITAFAICTLCALSVQAQTASGSQNGTIEKCERNFGTLAVVENSATTSQLAQYKLGSPSTMLRMIVQESGCFTVVERGAGLQVMQQERALAGSGMMQQSSNVGGGQMQAADFVLTPNVQFAADTGGVGGAIGGMLGRMGGVLGKIGGLAGGVSFKEAETTILVSDVRAGIQVASAEGQASKMNFILGGWGWGDMGWASAGGYSKTPEGKLVAASLLDNYNRIVLQVRNRASLIQASSASSQANAAQSIQATALAPPAQVIVTHAPVVLAPAPVAMPNPGPSAVMQSGFIPIDFTGRFFCTISGAAQGTLNLFVARNGAMQGIGNVVGAPGAVTVSGDVNTSGQVLASSSHGMARGQMDASGKMKGLWAGVQNTQGDMNCERR